MNVVIYICQLKQRRNEKMKKLFEKLMLLIVVLLAVLFIAVMGAEDMSLLWLLIPIAGAIWFFWALAKKLG